MIHLMLQISSVLLVLLAMPGMQLLSGVPIQAVICDGVAI